MLPERNNLPELTGTVHSEDDRLYLVPIVEPFSSLFRTDRLVHGSLWYSTLRLQTEPKLFHHWFVMEPSPGSIRTQPPPNGFHIELDFAVLK